jgi:hypothetical protein
LLALPRRGGVCSNSARRRAPARLDPSKLPETFMKQLITLSAVLALAISTSAFANSHKEAPGMAKAASAPMAAPMAAPAGSCAAAAEEKKLAGAAKTSFMKKCESDATASCDAKAAEKKLAGAAKTSFTKKCVADASAAK